jgi:hypothetical protein
MHELFWATWNNYIHKYDVKGKWIYIPRAIQIFQIVTQIHHLPKKY